MTFKFATVDHNLHKIYKQYCIEVPTQIQTTKENFFKVNKQFVEKAVEKILKAEQVKFPLLGSFRIQKFMQDFTDTSKLRVDLKKSRELGKTMYFMNEHTDGYVYKWKWHKNFRHKYIPYYSFLPARYTVRRKLPWVLKNTNQQFFC